MSRKTQVIDFLRQQSRNRNEQVEMLRRGHNPSAAQVANMREAARMFEDAARMCEAFEGPVTVTSEESNKLEVAEALAAEKAEAAPKIAEAPKQRKKWTRKQIEDSKLGPAIAANDRD